MKNEKTLKEESVPLSEKEIGELKRASWHRSGCWEIDWGPEPFSQMLEGENNQLTLTLVVHQESCFVLEMRVGPPEEIGKGVSAFINAIRKQMVLPDLIAVRDKILGDELVPLARALDCTIKMSPLKAIPQIRRDMKRLMR